MAKKSKEESSSLNGYSLTSEWFEFVLDNPDKVTGNHTALYLWLVQINNRCQWREKFQITTRESMDGMSCKSRATYTKCFDHLVEWGFVSIVIRSTNQYQCTVISLHKKCTTTGTDTDQSTGTDTGQITGHIPKQLNNETLKTINIEFDVFWDLYDKKINKDKCKSKWDKLKDSERDDIIKYLPKYKASQSNKTFRKHPETFLNNKSWEDEILINDSSLLTSTTDNSQKHNSENDPFAQSAEKTRLKLLKTNKEES